MVGTSYPTDSVISLYVPSPSFGLHYSWDIFVSVRTHIISTPLYNCMVEFEYGIFPSLHNHMVVQGCAIPTIQC